MAFTSYLDNIKKQLEEIKQEALESIAITIKDRMVELCPVDSGNLQGHIDYEIKDGMLFCGVWNDGTVDYAIYVEKGSRFKEAHPFIKPALQDFEDEYKREIEKIIERRLGGNA